jgi:hypothetical protein
MIEALFFWILGGFMAELPNNSVAVAGTVLDLDANSWGASVGIQLNASLNQDTLHQNHQSRPHRHEPPTRLACWHWWTYKHR